MKNNKQTLLQNKVYCSNCIRWYFTGVDQCEIPSCGIPIGDRFNTNKAFGKAVGKKVGKVDKVGQKFIKSHIKYIHSYTDKKIYGSPSQLNINNDCYFYKTLPKYLRWLTPVVRMFQF